LKGLRLVAVAAAALGAVLIVGSGLLTPFPAHPDAMAYRTVAERLMAGGQLYPHTSPDDPLAYRYAPWFAFAFIPFAWLGDAGMALWYAVIAVSAFYVVAATFRLGGPPGLVLGLLALPILGAIPGGNVGVPMVALLIATRMHPVSVGVAASLKVYPLLLVAGYLAERRWRDAALAIAVAAVLWAPALLFDLSGYITSPGAGGISLFAIHPLLWIAQDAILIAAVAWLAIRGSRWTWLAAAATVPLFPPRIFLAGTGYFTAAAQRIRATKRTV
jgi:hypothetical protein